MVDKTLEDPNIDIVVRGEGEVTFFEQAKENDYFDIDIDWTRINLLYDSTIPTAGFSTEEVPELRKSLLNDLKQCNPEKYLLDK